MDNKADRRAGAATEILIEMSYKRNGTDLLLFEVQRGSISHVRIRLYRVYLDLDILW